MAATLAASLLAEIMENTAQAAADELQFPRVQGFGGVYSIDGMAEQPKPGMKVLFDVTTEAKPGELNKGLEVVARFLNMAALGGLGPTQMQVAVVLHGQALVCCMNHKVYTAKTAFKSANPNEKLIRALAETGIPLLACSQAVRRQKFTLGDLLDNVKPVTSAMIVSIDRQQQGWAVLLPH
jgi:intracellular sulfur oxidation DsrE/DsrF family protein